ncbi:antitoxin Xre/MbcA/ParS toxin-binding domain-containing protein [Mycolicibacter kumamotonensis]|uniref:Uncharacterized protein n=1 Tax=Mycolicibacter kumamotonensis TaxID=354243 RepID=A0A1B8S9M2_9MYCO|nr:antitoxin Xre/MbcA/ParS toxin-binding domain-containing protein [Mycolicibacter kumamotonensis]OBY29427.1 hypothetical protein ACT18_23105 [Mycolicibacter kumamotonensis]
MPVPTKQKVAALIHDLGTERLADLLDVDPEQLERWQLGEGVDEANASRVDLLEVAMAHLLRLFTSEAALRWLVGLNPDLGDRRPADLIRRGRTHEVLDAIASARAGSFA